MAPLPAGTRDRPQTLAAFPEGRKVAYLSLDMNIVVPEIAAIEFFWDRLEPALSCCSMTMAGDACSTEGGL